MISDGLWAEQRPPEPTPGSASLGDWELPRAAALTAARHELGARLARGAAGAAPDSELLDRLLLTFEELASNGVRHGGPPVRVRVARTGRGFLVDVTDAAVDQPPVPAVDRDPAQGGLGLHLVARLCPAHGWAVEDGRKHVWAHVDAVAG